MKTCIICRTSKEDADFNKEHVIPEAIGGYYCIYTVCKVCNVKLGTKVDAKLTNHIIVEVERRNLGIRGKVGYGPKGLARKYQLKDKPGEVTLEWQQDGTLAPFVFSRFVEPDNPNELKLVMDQRDLNRQKIIVDKHLNRKSIKKENVLWGDPRHVIEKQVLQGKMVLDLKDFKLALLKIAYEFTIDNIPSYFDDPEATNISKILETTDHNAIVTAPNFLTHPFDREGFKQLDQLISLDNKNHYLILHNLKEYGLVCYVNLFDKFYCVVWMSKSSYSVEPIFGKNDILNKQFKIYKTIDIIGSTYNQTRHEFQYQVSSLHLLDRKDFSIIEHHKEPSLYSSQGNKIYPMYSMMLEESGIVAEESFTTTENIKKYTFDEELYVKEVHTNQLIRVTGMTLFTKRPEKV